MPSKTTLAVLLLSFLVDTEPSFLNHELPLLNPINKSTQKGSIVPQPTLSDTKNPLKLPVKKQQNVNVFSLLPQQSEDPNCKRPSRLQRYSKTIYQNPTKTATVEKKSLPTPDVSVSSKTVSKTNTIPNPPAAKNQQQVNTSYFSPLQKLTLDDISPKSTNANANLKQNQNSTPQTPQTPQTNSQFKILQVQDHGVNNPDPQPQIPEDGENYVQGDDNQLLGKYNLINGNSNSLVGLNNIIRGEGNKLIGKSNKIVGFENYAVGNQNGIIGVSNQAMGNSNAVIGTKNNIQGNGNTLQTSKSIIIGNNNVIKTSKL